MVYVAEKRVYLNTDRSAVVPEDSPDAAFLLVAEGGQLTDEEAAQYGLKAGAKAETAETDAEEKAVEAPANKARSRAEDK